MKKYILLLSILATIFISDTSKALEFPDDYTWVGHVDANKHRYITAVFPPGNYNLIIREDRGALIGCKFTWRDADVIKTSTQTQTAICSILITNTKPFSLESLIFNNNNHTVFYKQRVIKVK